MTADPVALLQDRADIVATVGRYGRAIDVQDWTLLRSCLADTVHVDFSRYSRPQGPPAAERAADEWVNWVRSFVGTSIRTEHLTANHDVDLDGDRARVSFSLAVRRHQETGGAIRDNASHAHATYDLRRHDGRWTITALSAELAWLAGDPTIGSPASE